LAATKKEFEAKLAAKDTQIAEREAKLKADSQALSKRQAEFENQVAAKVKAETAQIAADERKKARLLLENDIAQRDKQLVELNEVLKTRDAKLAEAQKEQAELMRLRRALEDEKRELGLTVEKKVEEALAGVREKVVLEAEEQFRLKLAERDEEKASLQRKVD